MLPMVLEMREAVDIPIAFVPNGYRTSRRGWEASPEAMHIYGIEMAMNALQAKTHGVHYIGGSDGAGPRLVRAMAQALERERYHVGLYPRAPYVKRDG